MFGGNNKKSRWNLEYEDTIYKIYDWNRNLAAYFYPNYELVETNESEDKLLKNLPKHIKMLEAEIFSFR